MFQCVSTVTWYAAPCKIMSQACVDHHPVIATSHIKKGREGKKNNFKFLKNKYLENSELWSRERIKMQCFTFIQRDLFIALFIAVLNTT